MKLWSSVEMSVMKDSQLLPPQSSVEYLSHFCVEYRRLAGLAFSRSSLKSVHLSAFTFGNNNWKDQEGRKYLRLFYLHIQHKCANKGKTRDRHAV